MAKISDNIIFGGIFIIFVFAWLNYWTKNTLLSLLSALLIFSVIRMGLFALKSGRLKNREMSVNDMCFYLALKGKSAVTAIFESTIPATKIIGVNSPFILVNEDGNKSLLFINYKYGKTLPDEIALSYRKAKDVDAKKIYVLSERTERNVMVMTSRLDVEYSFPSKRSVRKYLIIHNALPAPIEKKKKSRIKLSIPDLLAAIFDRGRIKYYLFTSCVLILLSFFTPLKLYYLILSSVPAILAIISLFIKSEQ